MSEAMPYKPHSSVVEWVILPGLHPSLADARAASDLLKEVYGAKVIRSSVLAGLVYQTYCDIPVVDQEVLGIFRFN